MTKSRPASSDASLSATLTWSEALSILVTTGLAIGTLRVAGLGLASFEFDRFVQQGVNLVWTAPLGTTILTLVWGAVIWLTGGVAPMLRQTRLFTAASVWLPAYSLVLNLDGIHPAAAALLAAGLASVIFRLAPGMLAKAIAMCGPVARLGTVGLGVVFAVMVLGRPSLEAIWSSQVAPPQAGAPNIILIVLDTVREKSLGSGGHGHATSPFLDELGRSSVRFTQAYSPAPWTTHSHASMMTGLWPTELGVGWITTLDDTHPTVAEVLRAAGYLTAGFVANVGNAGGSSGIARGFSHFEDYPVDGWEVIRGSKCGERIVQSIWLRNLLGSLSEPNRKRSPQVNAEFLSWLDRQEDRPFFAFLNYFDAHDPYEAPPKLEAQFGVPAGTRRATATQLDWMKWDAEQIDVALRLHESAIAFQDAQLRRLFAELAQRGKLDNTLVIVTSDHGEEFGEHGVMRHGNSLYRPALHVPLVVSFPNRLAGGRVVSTPVSIRSIAATLAQAVPGLRPDLFRGPGLLDVAKDPALGEPVFSSVKAMPAQPESFPVHDGPLYAVVDQGYRYIVNGKGVEQLFQLSGQDEHTNLATSPAEQDILADLRTRVARFRAINTPAVSSPPIEAR